MKWLISKEEFQPGRRFENFDEDDFKPPNAEGIVGLKQSNPLIDESFVIYEDDNRLSQAIMDPNKFHEWKTYPLGKKFKAKQKINYECFCGGYLDYYNRSFSSEGKDKTGKVIDRLLYLKWIDGDKKKGIIKAVTLIISNPPDGEGYRKSIQDFIKKNTNISLTADPPPADTQDDPDPPPGPPPPPDA